MKESSNSNESVWHSYDLLHYRVLDQEGKPLGRVADLVADLREHDPPITGLIVSGPDKNSLHVPWSWVEEWLTSARWATLEMINDREHQVVRID